MKPDFIRGTDKDSFAWYTITQRLPYIIDAVIKSNVYNHRQVEKLEELKGEIPNGNLSTLHFNSCRDEFFLNDRNNWLEVPFIFAEFYFYKRLLECTEYFETALDPFEKTKKDSLESKKDEIICAVNAVFKSEDLFKKLLYLNLWSNSADLSQINKMDSSFRHDNQDKILIDHSEEVCKLFKQRLAQTDIILDNAGFELSMDLILSFFLLESKVSDMIYLHAKKYPIFVSDVTEADIKYTLNFFLQVCDSKLMKIGERIYNYIRNGKIVISTDAFWTLPCSFINFDEAMKKHFENSDLTIIKGDLNYRRIVEDRKWDHTIDFNSITKYFPSNLLVIRTLKSEVVVGLDIETVKRLNAKEKNWLTSGDYGILQLGLMH
ncbi:MAG TPA: damage-control phosphatase ARMT1 family protein [Clostridia bacterium]